MVSIISLVAHVATLNTTCKCSDNGGSYGCGMAPQNCTWENNACVKVIQNCSILNSTTCYAPGCLFNNNTNVC